VARLIDAVARLNRVAAARRRRGRRAEARRTPAGIISRFNEMRTP